MLKKRILLLSIVLIILFMGASVAYSQVGLRFGFGLDIPAYLSNEGDAGPGGYLNFSNDIGIYYMFKNGGAFGMELLCNWLYDFQIHLAYIHEFMLESRIAPGFFATIGFNIVEFNVGFGFKVGVQISYAPTRNIRFGFRAAFSLSYSSGKEEGVIVNYLLLSFPMNIFFQFGF